MDFIILTSKDLSSNNKRRVLYCDVALTYFVRGSVFGTCSYSMTSNPVCVDDGELNCNIEANYLLVL